MNIDQLKSVLAIDEEGSVSRAAKKLFISQSTLSNSIASLEREVGFLIFDRNNRGMRATAQGRELISYARSIVHFSEDIMSLSDSDYKKCRFRLVSSREEHLNKVFTSFCLAHKDDASIDISFASASVEHTIEMIYRNLADYGIICIDKPKLNQVEHQCKNRGVILRLLTEMTLEVICAENHPLMQEKDLLRALPLYPCIAPPDYASHLFIEEVERRIDSPMKGEHRKIIVADRETRLDLLSQGVGYMLGIMDRTAKKRNLASRKLDMRYGIYSLVSKDKKDSPLIQEFERLLRDE
jgi:DNA-binding transcriptional LysR family regulator